MSKRKLLQKEKDKKEAKIKIDELFGKSVSQNLPLAHKSVRKARSLAMKYKIRLPRKYQTLFCKHCYHFLKPGVNARVRTKNKMIIYYCIDCKKFTKYAIRKK